MGHQEQDTRFEFNLSANHAEQRDKIWKDKLNEFFYDLDFKLPDDFNSGSFRGCRAGELSFANIRSDAMSVFRTASHVARSSRDCYFLLLPRGGRILLSQRGNEAGVGNGEFTLASADEPYTCVVRNNELFNNLVIPGHIMRQLSSRALNRVARPSQNSPMTRIFTTFANNLCENIGNYPGHSRSVLFGMLINLLERTLEDADHRSNHDSVKFVHRQRILQLIDQEFRDPSFGTRRISEVLGISPRYIHEIFSGDGGSVSDIIRMRRLTEARHLLAVQGLTRIFVSTVAHDVGFSSLSHFRMAFKQETGVLPSEYVKTRTSTDL